MSTSAVEMVCIACPLGCRLTVTAAAGDEVTVSGNRCPKGEVYAREGLTDDAISAVETTILTRADLARAAE